jgi:hypothetical protein
VICLAPRASEDIVRPRRQASVGARPLNFTIRSPCVNVLCEACGKDNAFAQPNRYHAGFGDQGFLYNDAGNLTLVWGSYDPAYTELVGKVHPWMLTEAQRSILENALVPAPTGGHWRFANPPRCMHCGAPIGDPLSAHNIYYLKYPGTIDLDIKDASTSFAAVLRSGS